jgi:hypothetical protein
MFCTTPPWLQRDRGNIIHLRRSTTRSASASHAALAALAQGEHASLIVSCPLAARRCRAGGDSDRTFLNLLIRRRLAIATQTDHQRRMAFSSLRDHPICKSQYSAIGSHWFILEDGAEVCESEQSVEEHGESLTRMY